MTTLYWMQTGGCGGDTMSFINISMPDFYDLFKFLNIELLWHPSLSTISCQENDRIIDEILTDKRKLNILIIEGAQIRGPANTGMYHARDNVPQKKLVIDLSFKADYVIALGTCASFGGFGADTEIQAAGLQYVKTEKGGLLGENFRSLKGFPVINLAGCPCHPEVLAETLDALIKNQVIEVDEYGRPTTWYGIMVHQGCTRNEYHEYRVEENDFGQKGCLFFHKGCHGPLVGGPCNKLLWNRRNSKTRAGIPCFGCTSPDFPLPYPFFETRNIEGIPISLPNGISRAHYLVYKEMAAAAAPKRLKDRETEV